MEPAPPPRPHIANPDAQPRCTHDWRLYWERTNCDHHDGDGYCLATIRRWYCTRCRTVEVEHIRQGAQGIDILPAVKVG